MIDFFTALAVAFGVIFVAELGDKSQLLALNFGARYPLRTVVVGLTVGYAAAGLIATVVGGVLGAALPDRPIEIVGGSVFLLFAVLALRDDDDGDGDVADSAVHVSVARSVIVSIALTIAVAEMGDKTQIATAALAAQANPVATWIGATGRGVQRHGRRVRGHGARRSGAPGGAAVDLCRPVRCVRIGHAVRVALTRSTSLSLDHSGREVWECGRRGMMI